MRQMCMKVGRYGRHVHLIMVWMCLVVMTACSSSHTVSVVRHALEPPEDSHREEPAFLDEDVDGGRDRPVPSREKDPVVQDDSLPLQAEPVLPMVLKDVFFDYDRYVIRPEAIPVLQMNAKILLQGYPARDVVIQGHCDERGTEEYNLILGERRAAAVKKFLKDLGVPAKRLFVLSFGKTQPFCFARTPDCFQQNRRAHFILK